MLSPYLSILSLLPLSYGSFDVFSSHWAFGWDYYSLFRTVLLYPPAGVIDRDPAWQPPSLGLVVNHTLCIVTWALQELTFKRCAVAAHMHRQKKNKDKSRHALTHTNKKPYYLIAIR